MPVQRLGIFPFFILLSAIGIFLVILLLDVYLDLRYLSFKFQSIMFGVFVKSEFEFVMASLLVIM